VPAAALMALLANVHRDPDSHPEPFTPAQFMPGAKSEDDEMREFAEAVMRGDTFEVDPEALDRFKRQMQSSFRNVAMVDGEKRPAVEIVRTVRTNAIGGESPRRGVN
jgi:hypothetical protein